MIYLDDKFMNTNYFVSPQLANPAMSLSNINKSNEMATDTVSFSGKTKESQNDKNKLIAWLLGGTALAAGIALLILKIRKGKATPIGDIERTATEIINPPSSSPLPSRRNNGGGSINHPVPIEPSSPSSGSVSLDARITRHNEHIAGLQTQEAQLQKRSQQLDEEIAGLGIKRDSQPPAKKVSPPPNVSEEATLNHAYDMYSEKLATDFKLKEKQSLIREAMPDLMPLLNDTTAMKEVLELLTKGNKEFITKQAIPAILRNSEKLDLGKVVGSTLKAVTPETVDCLDRLAANVERFKIKSQGDSINLLQALTKENKEFAFKELLPYLADNAEKYKISRGGHMAKYLEFITPGNREFMLNQAIPTVLRNFEKLDIEVNDIPQIAKHLNKGNLTKLQTIADNIGRYDIKDSDGFLDLDKLNAILG